MAVWFQEPGAVPQASFPEYGFIGRGQEAGDELVKFQIDEPGPCLHCNHMGASRYISGVQAVQIQIPHAAAG